MVSIVDLYDRLLVLNQVFHQDEHFVKLLTFSVFTAFFVVQFKFIAKIMNEWMNV